MTSIVCTLLSLAIDPALQFILLLSILDRCFFKKIFDIEKLPNLCENKIWIINVLKSFVCFVDIFFSEFLFILQFLFSFLAPRHKVGRELW